MSIACILKSGSIKRKVIIKVTDNFKKKMFRYNGYPVDRSSIHVANLYASVAEEDYDRQLYTCMQF